MNRGGWMKAVLEWMHPRPSRQLAPKLFLLILTEMNCDSLVYSKF